MTQVETTSRLRVVTVDDSRIVTQRLESLIGDLSGIGFLTSATTISDALAIIETSKPHLVILDIHLSFDKPRNGIDLLNLVKKTYPVVKVIMLTNLTDQRYKTICEKSGADYFLDKSNDFDRIPAIIEEIYNETWLNECDAWWLSEK